jgi:hypothetical protein
VSLENDFTIDLVAAELVSLGEAGGASGLLDEDGNWRDEAVQLVQLVEAYRDGKEMSLLIASDLSSFRLMGWDESTERGLKALYFAEGWMAHQQMLTKANASQVSSKSVDGENTDW